MSIEAMKLALEALTFADEFIGMKPYEHVAEEAADGHRNLLEAIKALEEALAKQEQGEPVAHINQNGVIHEAGYPWGIHNTLEPLYRHQPQQRKPLTDEQIEQIYRAVDGNEFPIDFCREIEAAHGIKGEA
jgi:hypothetical protein